MQFVKNFIDLLADQSKTCNQEKLEEESNKWEMFALCINTRISNLSSQLKKREAEQLAKASDIVLEMPSPSLTITNVRQQNDAAELLLKLTTLFQWSPDHLRQMTNYNATRLYPRLATFFNPANSLPKGWSPPFPTVHDFNTLVVITIPESAIKANTPLDLDALINESEEVKLSLSKKRENENVIDRKEFKFKKISYLINKPRTLMVYIKRFQSDSLGKKRSKINLPIHLDSQMIINIKTKSNTGTDAQPNFITGPVLQYRIGAAIEHLSFNNSVDEGHYVCKERASNGSFILHDDATLKAIGSKNFASTGYFIRLDLIEK